VVLGLSVQALREGGAVVSNVYVDLSKDGLLFLVVIQEIYTENPVLMSTNNSVTSSLDSDKIVSTLKMEGLDSTNKLKNFEGAILLN
jgi:hypothetical protein